MPHGIAPGTNPAARARCPRQLLGEGPSCRALVLVGDADEHEAWHDRLDELLETPLAEEAPAPWPGRLVDDEPAAPTGPYA